MRTAAEYAEQFAAEKASTEATTRRNTLDYEDIEEQGSARASTASATNSDTGFEFNYKDYGLKKVDGGDKDDGVVSDGQGNYYKLKGFERQQKKGLDTDQGDVFDSDLYKHAKKYGDFSVSNFNTISDVEGAIRALTDVEEDEPEAPPEPYEYTKSEPLAQAEALVETWDDHIKSGGLTQSIFGLNPVTGQRGGPNPTMNWYQSYKQRVKDKLQPQLINPTGSETDYTLMLNQTGDKSWIAEEVITERDEEKKNNGLA